VTACERVLLVGFMGAGKSTVGPLLARALSWRFEDFDDRIEALAERTIQEIFRHDGEPRFREIEAEVAAVLLAEREVVLGSGGGWAAVPGRLRGLPPETVSVWLRVSPDVAVGRVAPAGGRPLLDAPEPLTAARRLVAEREAAYAAADVQVDTDGRTPEDVTSTILALLEGRIRNPAVGKR
jgi:shikimate kinase